MSRFARWIGGGVLLGLLVTGVLLSRTAEGVPAGEWRHFGGDAAYKRYSPLDQIDRANVSQLQVAWRRPAVDPELLGAHPDLTVPRYLLSSPQMIDGVLYAANGIGLVEAMDPATGATLWMQRPPAGEPLAGRGNRGLGYWTDGSDRRLFHVRGEYLYAVDRDTGEPAAGFGEGGRVRLRREGPRAMPFSSGSGVLVVGDVAVVAGLRGGAGDRSPVKEREPEDITGYDVRTGELLWTFHVIPREGEPGVETWEDGSWEFAGDAGAWCCLSADEELGWVYAPLSSPTGFYGGWRLGDNLFSNSLVAIDARTGERMWHYQLIRHGIWEHEPVGPPILADITVAGRAMKAVIQAVKTGYVFVFDRVTGEPVWPIEDRPVPLSTVPGEVAAPRQPFPTRPAPVDRIGLREEDLIDFTPELRARTAEFLSPYDLEEHVYAPPTLASGEPGGSRGAVTVPGTWGAANWNTGAFDPETGMYYAPSHTLPGVVAIVPAESEETTIGYPRVGPSPLYGPDGLPLTKPPYGRITAIDMNTGDHVWMRPNGDGPRDHPLLRGLDLPPLGTPNRPVPLLTKTLLFLGEGSDVIGGVTEFFGRTFRAYDKATGEVVWQMELPGGTTSQPMTYMHQGRQYVVVPVGDRDHPAEWVALALPSSPEEP